MRRFRVACAAAPFASSTPGVTVVKQDTVVEVTANDWLDPARALRQHTGRNVVQLLLRGSRVVVLPVAVPRFPHQRGPRASSGNDAIRSCPV